MTEKAREYKRRIDTEWRKNERNKDKLINKIKEYELFDDIFKKTIEKEIVEVFLKNEKEEKGEEYEGVVNVIREADKKYEVLDQMREKLRQKEEEKIEVEEGIKEAKFDGEDNTIVDKQMAEFDALVGRRESLGKEIEEIKKEISDIEEEIKESEEEYGKRSEIEAKIGDEADDEDDKVVFRERKKEAPATLKGYHDQTIKDLWDKDRKRIEILKILGEGAGIGDELSKKIEKEASEAFFTYYDEKQGSLRMKAGRREKNKLRRRESQEEERIEQENQNTDGVETSRERREKLIMQWYEKKLNRDELLRVLEEYVEMDKESKNKMKDKIMEEFYENYDKAREEEVYQDADAEYRNIKKMERQLKGKNKELEEKKEERRMEMERIDKEMEDIAQRAMKFENGSWWSKMKLGKAKIRRDELDKQEKEIRKEVGELEKEKKELGLSLRDKERRYGQRIDRRLQRPEKIGRNMSKEQEASELTDQQPTLKGYKIKYEKMIRDREEYNEKLLKGVKDMDIGVGEDEKNELLKELETGMKEGIKKMKEGDETMKKTEEIEKWLREDWKATMERLVELKKEIAEKEGELKELKSKGQGEDMDTIVQMKKREGKVRKEINAVKDKYEEIRSDIEEKMKVYEGTLISEEDFIVETFEERERRMLKRKLKEMYPYKGIGIEEVKNEDTLKGYKEKYEEMINDKEEYIEKLLRVVKDIDTGIIIEEKEELLTEIKIDMEKEIEGRKKSVKIADGMGKWFEESCTKMLTNLLVWRYRIREVYSEDEKLKLKNIYRKVENDLKEKISGYCGESIEGIGDIMIIGGEVSFLVKSKDGYYIYRGDTCTYRECEEIWRAGSAGDQPIYRVKDGDGDYKIYRGDDRVGFGSEEEIKDIQIVGDRPLFQEKDAKNGRYYMSRGDEVLNGCGYGSEEEIKDIQIEGDKPLFQIKNGWCYYMCRGGSILNGHGSEEEIKDIEIVGDKPLFQIKNGGYYYMYRGESPLNWYGASEERIKDIQVIGDKPVFKVKNSHGYYGVYRGNDLCGGYYKKIGKVQDEDGKPLFKYKDKNGGEWTWKR